MSLIVQWGIGFGVEHALALGGLCKFFGSSLGWPHGFGRSEGRLGLDLSLKGAIEDCDDVVDVTEAAALAQLLRC